MKRLFTIAALALLLAPLGLRAQVTIDNYQQYLQGTFTLRQAFGTNAQRTATRLEVLNQNGHVLLLTYRKATGEEEVLRYTGWNIRPLDARTEVKRGYISANRPGEQMNFRYERLTPDSFQITVHDNARYWAVRQTATSAVQRPSVNQLVRPQSSQVTRPAANGSRRVDTPTPGGANTTPTATPTPSASATTPTLRLPANCLKRGDNIVLVRKGQTAAPKELTKKKETVTMNGVSFNLLRVDYNELLMGQPGDYANGINHHYTRVDRDFYLGETEVTQQLYIAVMGSMPISHYTGAKHPMGYVTWQEALEFCAKLSHFTGLTFTLPTEAQWQLGAWNNYEDEDYLLYTWGKENSNGKTYNVASKQPNKHGLYDMMGNVWEWCLDSYGPFTDTHSGASINGLIQRESSQKIIRGGSATSEKKTYDIFYRTGIAPNTSDRFVGFRVCTIAPYNIE